MRTAQQVAIMRTDGYLTPQEAAERAGLSTASIYRLIKRDPCPVRTVRTSEGGAVYVDALSLAEHYQTMPPIRRRVLEGFDVERLTELRTRQSSAPAVATG